MQARSTSERIWPLAFSQVRLAARLYAFERPLFRNARHTIGRPPQLFAKHGPFPSGRLCIPTSFFFQTGLIKTAFPIFQILRGRGWGPEVWVEPRGTLGNLVRISPGSSESLQGCSKLRGSGGWGGGQSGPCLARTEVWNRNWMGQARQGWHLGSTVPGKRQTPVEHAWVETPFDFEQAQV